MIRRYDVIGCKISAVNLDRAVDAILRYHSSGDGGYVCFANVHVTVTAYRSAEYRALVNGSLLTLADGKPVYWLGRILGNRDIQHIAGPDFLPIILAQKSDPPLRHYFYGGRPEVLEELIQSLKRRFPGALFVGWDSPPFRELSAGESAEAIMRIKDSKADIVWVGLGTPKQDYWMRAHRAALSPAILMGVGAAFDFHAGCLKRAPRWMRLIGLEWLYRLMQEPRRLWRRYLVDNTRFVLYVFWDLIFRKQVD